MDFTSNYSLEINIMFALVKTTLSDFKLLVEVRIFLLKSVI
jgi:hypothetical protein